MRTSTRTPNASLQRSPISMLRWLQSRTSRHSSPSPLISCPQLQQVAWLHPHVRLLCALGSCALRCRRPPRPCLVSHGLCRPVLALQQHHARPHGDRPRAWQHHCTLCLARHRGAVPRDKGDLCPPPRREVPKLRPRRPLRRGVLTA